MFFHPKDTIYSRRDVILRLGPILGFSVISTPVWARSETEAIAFITQLGKDVIEIFKSETDPGERRLYFREIFLGTTDIRRFGLFVLGRYARKMPHARRAEYYDLLKDYLTEIYVTRFAAYAFTGEESLNISEARQKGSKGIEFIVSSSLSQRFGKEPIPILWWVFIDADNFRIFDIQVAGIWLAQEQRAQFSSLISARGGGDPEILFEILPARIEAARLSSPNTP